MADSLFDNEQKDYLDGEPNPGAGGADVAKLFKGHAEQRPAGAGTPDTQTDKKAEKPASRFVNPDTLATFARIQTQEMSGQLGSLEDNDANRQQRKDLQTEIKRAGAFASVMSEASYGRRARGEHPDSVYPALKADLDATAKAYDEQAAKYGKAPKETVDRYNKLQSAEAFARQWVEVPSVTDTVGEYKEVLEARPPTFGNVLNTLNIEQANLDGPDADYYRGVIEDARGVLLAYNSMQRTDGSPKPPFDEYVTAALQKSLDGKDQRTRHGLVKVKEVMHRLAIPAPRFVKVEAPAVGAK